MARKNVVESFEILADADLSGSITSESFNVKNMDKATIRLAWTSADAIGAFKFQARQELSSSPEVDSQWFDLEGLTSLPVDMTAPSPDSEHQIIFESMPFVELRVQYSPTSGTGTVNGKITLKQVGG